jgi:prephenate dehydratase
MTVAFQGERGAYSEEAARTFFKTEDVLPCPNFRKVFEAVSSGTVEAGMIPVENSQAGSIVENYDLLQEFALTVVGELPLRIRHCLLALPGTQLKDIERVISHPQALAQSEEFTRAHGWVISPEYDTAGSAKMVSEKKLAKTGAIASRISSEIYQLDILAEGIETNPHNYTRFLAVSKTPAPKSAKSKTSLVFATANQPGALYRVLGVFAARNLNITKLESRPMRKVPWEYLFYLDFEGHTDDEPVKAALQEASSHTAFLRVLGAYPSANS